MSGLALSENGEANNWREVTARNERGDVVAVIVRSSKRGRWRVFPVIDGVRFPKEGSAHKNKRDAIKFVSERN